MPKILERLLRAGEGRILKKLDGHRRPGQRHRGGLRRSSPTPSCAPRPTTSRQRLADGETLDDLLPEAFAAVREAAKRTLGQRHFDVQIMGGAALHLGNIAEMKTGEGKTLVATLPAYLNALAGKGVHVVTVNDYLAKYQTRADGPRPPLPRPRRPACILADDDARASAARQYAADITYGTNNEFGFDYLRDNMAWSLGRAACSAATTSRSSTRSTRSSSTRPARR